MENLRLGVSACLLGRKVRYDGGQRLDRYVTETLGRYFRLVPVCPEADCGLPVPREAMRLEGEPDAPRLVAIRTGADHTEGMLNWARKRLREMEREDLSGFVFKSGSPSSGIRGVKVYDREGRQTGRGAGIFASAFMGHFPLIPVEDEERLGKSGMRENFIARVFVYRRWREAMKGNCSPSAVEGFHMGHRLLAHSQRRLAALDRLVAEAGKGPPEGL